MPKTYAVATRILTEIKYKFNGFKPEKFIDFGSGLGAGGLAFLDTFDPECKEVYGVEPSPKMRKMNQYLNQDKI
jgi:ribosomal protein RSM22 (predicted rRNA methylase)